MAIGHATVHVIDDLNATLLRKARTGIKRRGRHGDRRAGVLNGGLAQLNRISERLSEGGSGQGKGTKRKKRKSFHAHPPMGDSQNRTAESTREFKPKLLSPLT